MAIVKETCLCGATFEYSHSDAAAVAIAASQFRREHQACRIVANAERKSSAPAISRHGRDCGCTPCRAEDWDAIDAGITASRPASRQDA